jgi:hypothetical protein
MKDFINPLSSVCNTGSICKERPSYYNCILKNYSIDNWICVGPYNTPNDATTLKDIGEESELRKHKLSILINTDGYIPDRLDIKRKIIKYSFPIITVIDSNDPKK